MTDNGCKPAVPHGLYVLALASHHIPQSPLQSLNGSLPQSNLSLQEHDLELDGCRSADDVLQLRRRDDSSDSDSDDEPDEHERQLRLQTGEAACQLPLQSV